MGLFAYIKNGVKYKMNQFPGAYPASRVSYNGSDVETALDELNADKVDKTWTLIGIKTGLSNPQPLTDNNEYYIEVNGSSGNQTFTFFIPRVALGSGFKTIRFGYDSINGAFYIRNTEVILATYTVGGTTDASATIAVYGR